jgi:hypothetical protein
MLFLISEQRENFPVQSIQSPKTLLFGALSEIPSSSKKGSAQIKRSLRSMLDSEISTSYEVKKSLMFKMVQSWGT